LIDLRALSAAAGLLALIATGPAHAAECRGKPDALGTSRTLVVDPNEHIRLGMMQYSETLPLADREVVLTFDDGPLPPYTSRVLDLLAAECVKATFFLVGQMAKANPDLVRRIHAEGHTIGTHSNSHPFTFHRMLPQQADAEVEGGIASVAAALGDRNAVAPFFRIPGLMRGDTIERYLASRTLMTWSADFPADDWKHISANEIAARALQRIEARGRGMLLLHDIKPATALAMPVILSELKRRGYRIVHVEPATPDRAKTATLPSQWLVHRNGKWPSPELSIELLLVESVLPAPAPVSFGLANSFSPGEAIAVPRLRFYAVARGQIPLPPKTPWPRLQPQDEPVTTLAHAKDAELPAPSLSSFGYGDDFAPMIPEPGSLQRQASFPPLPETNGPSRLSASAGDAASVRPRQARRQVETAGILRFLFPFRLAKPM
jgi:peptidoglycan/xylan/chitin deacetylase (PgdA/CDA1 family)